MKANTCALCMWSVLSLVLMLGAPGACAGKIWALLIAGSTYYTDYSMQGNVCHSYHVFSDQGVPDEQIVVMMYDNIAYHEQNPFPGNIINEPDGPNVYPGVPHDYIGDDVSPEVLLAVLQGDRDRVYELTGYHGKVIDSGPDDHVFIHFDSHGGRGYFVMPHDKYLFASRLNDVLQRMHDQERFDKLVIYMDTCYAGSMFQDILPEDIGVYAATSSHPKEGAYFCFFDLSRMVYLSSEFVYSWLQNSEHVDLRYETLQEQFDIILEEVEKSHPQQYGDLSFTSWPVSEFMGEGKTLKVPIPKQSTDKGACTLVPRNEVEIYTLEQLLADPRQASRHEKIMVELKEKLRLQAQTDLFFSSLVNAAVPDENVHKVLSASSDIKQRAAYEYAVEHLMDVCPRLRPSVNKFALGKMDVLVKLSNTLSLRKVLAAVGVTVTNSPLCS